MLLGVPLLLGGCSSGPCDDSDCVVLFGELVVVSEEGESWLLSTPYPASTFVNEAGGRDRETVRSTTAEFGFNRGVDESWYFAFKALESDVDQVTTYTVVPWDPELELVNALNPPSQPIVYIEAYEDGTRSTAIGGEVTIELVNRSLVGEFQIELLSDTDTATTVLRSGSFEVEA